MRPWRASTVLAVITVVGMFAGLRAEPAVAATIRHVATTGSDTGDCVAAPCRTIGYAIVQSVSGDTISVAAGTYAENVVIDKSITLIGAGARSTAIDGSSTGRVIGVYAPSASLTVTIARLTIQNGRAGVGQLGGGIWSTPDKGYTNQINLSRSAVEANEASAGLGGGIYNGARSTMTISNSTVANNSALGAGPYIPGEGGGIYNAGTLSVSGSTVSGNVVVGGRGGMGFNHQCLGGGIGSGGGIWGAATIVNSTIANNTAHGGPGAIACAPPNHGSPGGNGSGGGLEASGSVTLVNSTVGGNSVYGGAGTGGQPSGTGKGGGIHVSASVSVTNTIVATDLADDGPDCDGTVTSGGHNLLGSDASCAGFTGSGDLVDVDPLLGPLQGNHGPTFTMAPGTGSPAIDAGDDAVCAAPPVQGVDQRGLPRPGGTHCDIGAFEVQTS